MSTNTNTHGEAEQAYETSNDVSRQIQQKCNEPDFDCAPLLGKRKASQDTGDLEKKVQFDEKSITSDSCDDDEKRQKR